MTNSSIPYRPEPTPPKTTSPVIICAIGTVPPMPLSDSMAPLTAPHEAAVVTTVQRAVRGDAEALLLALEVVADDSGRVHGRRGPALGEGYDDHGGEQEPAITA